MKYFISKYFLGQRKENILLHYLEMMNTRTQYRILQDITKQFSEENA